MPSRRVLRGVCVIAGAFALGACAGENGHGHAPAHTSAVPREYSYGGVFPQRPEPPPATAPTAEVPAGLPLVVREPGTVAFLSAVAHAADDAPDAPDAPRPRVIYVFGEPLYAEITLPLTIDEYRDRYGMDAFEVELRFARPQVHCRAIVPPVRGRVVTVALLRDARFSADVDLTGCLIEEMPHYTSPPRWSSALVELSGTSKSPAIRRRVVAHDTIDLGIESATLAEHIEHYAIVDRRLRHRTMRDGDTTGERFPPSRMPDLDRQALAAVTTSTTSRRAVRAVITSDGWEYERDVKTRLARSRFVVGLAYYQSAPETCSVENAVWMQRIDGTQDTAALVARQSGHALPVPCEKL